MINKSDMLQDIERVLVSEEEIHARIKEVGAQIADDYRGKCPILVGVLKGVVPFFAEMANAISIPVQEDFMCITSRSACSFSMAIRARAAPSCRTVVRAGLTISHTGVSSNPATEISSGTAIPCPRRKLIRSMA